MDIPLGDSLTLYRFVGGGALSAEYRMPFFPMLYIDGGLGYTFYQIRNAAAAEQSLSILSAGIGLGLQFTLLPRLAARLFFDGGYSYGFSNDFTKPQSGGGSFIEAGTKLSYDILPAFSLGLGVSYRNEVGLFEGLSVTLGTGFRFMGPPGEALELRDIQFLNIFPVFHKYYDDHPVGSAVISNTGSYPLTNIRLSVEIKPYMTAPKLCTTQAQLAPGDSMAVDLFALFSEEQILAVTEGTKASAEITWEYVLNGSKQTGKRVETVRIMNRNAMTWEDDRQAAAFVTALDPAVLTFSKNVSGVAKTAKGGALDPGILTAIAVYEGLYQYGMSYVVDPHSSYADKSQNRAQVDFLQFPQQTLEYKGGDCDDLSILFCALFESVGIETAFITIPGHIFMAFALGRGPEEARVTFQQHPDDIIYSNDKAWFPVEVTALDGKFLEAWQLGVKEWREGDAVGKAALYPLHEAWQTYEPVGLIGGTFKVAVPRADAVAAAYQREMQRLVEREIHPQITRLQEEITKSQSNIGAMNRLGVLYAKYGLLDQAERQFLAVLARQEYVPTLMNLGNISYMRKDMKKAVGYYERAYEKVPDDPKVIVNLARGYWETENYAPIGDLYRKLAAIDPNLAAQFAYLDMQGDASKRAADQGGAREYILWAEE